MNEPVRPDELRVSDAERAVVRRVHPPLVALRGRSARAVLGVLYAARIGRPES